MLEKQEAQEAVHRWVNFIQHL